VPEIVDEEVEWPDRLARGASTVPSPDLDRNRRLSALQVLLDLEAKEEDVLELCPRGNNIDVIIIILVHDNVYIPC
jgi:hypothetical protein